MHSYSYHLKLELYPTSNPDTYPADNLQRKPDQTSIWVPAPGSSLFDDLPAHPRARRAPSAARPRQLYRPTQPYPEEAVESTPAAETGAPPSGVIDCGPPRAIPPDGDDQHSSVQLSERQWRNRSRSFPPPGFSAGIGPRTAAKDWRFGRVSIESFDLVGRGPRRGEGANSSHAAGATAMAEQGDYMHPTPAASLGPNLGGAGQATKAQYVPLETKNTEAGWGIVHLYREGEEPDVPGSSAEQLTETETEKGGTSASASTSAGAATNEDDGAILCIPAVPSYLSPSDFLGFIGEKWRGDVSHYRMVMTSRMNRYMVLMKFKDKWRAMDWRQEFDGKVFNSMVPEICHVTFIKSITVETPSQTKLENADSTSANLASSLKPFPPPTPDLIELPTCPVCLERMDDTAGLMTILCQHVFHCTCLQTWKGSGCPVCRATNPTPGEDHYDANNPFTQPFGHGASNLCSVCDSADDLWICLICGNVGCGRYKGGHAKEHWKETAHSFSLELETQHVWDYAGDMWVHRLIRDKGDGKVFEFPSNESPSSRRPPHPDGEGGGGGGEDEDVVPRAKLDRIGIEYTHLLTSQLESQRVYFEEMVNKAVDKASKATHAAEAAGAQADKALRELLRLEAEHRTLRGETVPVLEKDLAREHARAAKSTELARSLGKALQEEKQVSEGLMKRIDHVHKETEEVRAALQRLEAENEELKETNRDLTMFISGQEKLRELENEGKIEQGEAEEGSVSLPEEKKRKGKGKAKR